MLGPNISITYISPVCGDRNPFWDSNLSWHTSNPDLTLCFLKTVPVWTSAILLWLLTLLTCLVSKTEWSKRKTFIKNEKTTIAIPTDEYTPLLSAERSPTPPSYSQLIQRWRLWSAFFSIKLAALGIMIVCTAIGEFCFVCFLPVHGIMVYCKARHHGRLRGGLHG